MEFTDEGVVLAARAHGEAHAVVDILTSAHGLWAGLVYGGQGRNARPLLQPGNGVRAVWKGRLAESLGHFTLDLETPRAAHLMDDRLALAGLAALTSLAAAATPEREVHAGVYEGLIICLDHLEDADVWPALAARWELGLLAALGFGLNLSACAASGSTEDLIYVSPKSARAVSAAAGEPYKDKLLPLPAFLSDRGGEASRAEALAALQTTGYFIETRILHPLGRTLPEARGRALDLLDATLEN